MFITDYEYVFTDHFIKRYCERLKPLPFEDLQKFVERELSEWHQEEVIFSDGVTKIYHYINGLRYVEINKVLTTIINEGGEDLHA
ncbi:hypothetical protein [Marinococcus halophilus]|uniref:hypothetical protein n=1 Tax=Marinococcus halophilus TaxID=1371 RepID=UPI0009A5A647|nr:hypothetical protein [Marinococcus halophilus]